MKKDKQNEKNVVVLDQEPQIHPMALDQSRHMSMIEAAINSNVDIIKLEKIMDLQERAEKNYARKAFYAALSNFQSQIPIIRKKGDVSYGSGQGKTQYSYAKIEDIAEAIKPYLVKNGLSYRYEQSSGEKELITITCVITHLDGHSESTEMSGYPDKSGGKSPMHSIASTVTYLRRYTITGAFGITVSNEDDDCAGSEESQVDISQAPVEYYDEDKFNKSLPAWMKSIGSGKKTPNDILQYLKGKNVNLSPKQIESITLLGK